MAATIVKRSRTPKQIEAIQRFHDEGRERHVIAAARRREERSRAMVGMQRVWAHAR